MISLDCKLQVPESGSSQGQLAPWAAGARQEFKAMAESQLSHTEAPAIRKRPIEEEIRMSYLEGLGESLLAASTALRPVVERALSLGFARGTLLAWHQ